MTTLVPMGWAALPAVRCAGALILTAGLIGIGGAARAASPAVTFSPYAEYATGDEPTSVAIGDLNGDDIADLVTVTTDPSVVLVRLGNGGGTFSSASSYITDTAPRSVAIGDLNGDTHPDLVTANYGDPLCEFECDDSGVSVFFGAGDGTFAPRIDFPAGAFPYSVAIGDLNGDTHPDLAVANPGSLFGPINRVSILLGIGDGTFAAPVRYVTGAEPTSVVIADLNGDTSLDLVTANFATSGTSSVSVLLGNGDGTFEPRTDYPADSNPLSVAAGDLNGDTIPDLAAASTGSNTVFLLLGNGDGTFEEAAVHPSTNPTPQTAAVGDLNGDSLLDLVVAGDGFSSVSVLLGNGDGTFDGRTDHPTPAGGHSMAIGDLNGDDRLDVATGHRDAATVSVLLNTTVPVVPAAPTIVGAVGGDAQATVSWTAPTSDGGSPVTGYVVTPYVGYSPKPSQTFSSTATTQVVTGLTNSIQYRFRVQAINAVGTGGFSKVTNPIYPAPAGMTVPGAPTIGSATAGDAQATVSWTAPASDGGSPVTGYVVTAYIGFGPQSVTTFVSTATTQVVTGLTNGSTYRFRVRAVNAVGIGGYSTVTNPVTPTA